MKSVKIVIITPYFAPAWSYGGPPRVLFSLAKELVKLGHNITVITSDSLGEERSNIYAEKLENIEIYRFRTISNFLCYKYKLFYIHNLYQKAWPLIKDAQRILFSDLRTFFNWQLYSKVRAAQIPYGVFPFGQIPYQANLKKAVKIFFDYAWAGDFIKSATWKFAQTTHEQEMYYQYFQIPKNKTQLLTLPIETEKLNVHHKNIGDSVNPPQKDKAIVFVGRLHYFKGVDILIEVFRTLMNKYKDINLLIVGRDDGYEVKLKTMANSDIGKRIFFPGPLYDNELRQVIEKAFCFVITPKIYEETSTAALQALSLGIPVVTTHQAELPYLEQYNAGYVSNNNISEIASAIEKLLKMSTQDLKLVKLNAKRLVKDHYDSTKVTQKLATYLQEKI